MTNPRIPLLNTFFLLFAIGCTSTPSNGDADVSDASVQDALAADGGDAAASPPSAAKASWTDASETSASPFEGVDVQPIAKRRKKVFSNGIRGFVIASILTILHPRGHT